MTDPPTFTISILALTRGYIVSGLGGAIACRTPSEVGRTVRNALLQVERHQAERLAAPGPPQPPLPTPAAAELPVPDFDPEPIGEGEEDPYITARRVLIAATDRLVAGLIDYPEFYHRLIPVQEWLDDDEIEAEIGRATARLNGEEIA